MINSEGISNQMDVVPVAPDSHRASYKRIAAIVAGTTALSFGAIAGATHFSGDSELAAANSSNPNDPDYWEARTTHESECFKHDRNSDHGKLNAAATGVILNQFNQSWYGDHWELLVVKNIC